jgi:hypothetical protein
MTFDETFFLFFSRSKFKVITRFQRYKTFFFINHAPGRKARAFVQGKPCQPNPMFASMAERIRIDHLKSASL